MCQIMSSTLRDISPPVCPLVWIKQLICVNAPTSNIQKNGSVFEKYAFSLSLAEIVWKD